MRNTLRFMEGSQSLMGSYRLVPAAQVGFPWAELTGPEGVVASLGRFSALNVFIGRGQRIELPGGRRWRLKSVAWSRFVCPVLVEGDKKLATSAPGPGSYAITCRDRGFTLVAAEHRPGRPRRWDLAEGAELVGAVRRHPFEAVIDRPAPLPAVLMAFGLAVLGVMGERELAAPMSWSAPGA